MSFLSSLWTKLRSPNAHYALGTLLVGGALLGAAGVVGFEYTMHATNSDEFCVSCHELRDNALVEFVGTSHHTNSTGVRVGCPDCHVPKEFGPKMVRKIRAATEVYHHLVGTIGTPEKYEEHRMWMASKTWAYMNATDSRECRHCHDSSSWDLELQSAKAREYHSEALSNGKTCIDCHKGLAHKLPKGIVEDEQIEGIDF